MESFSSFAAQKLGIEGGELDSIVSFTSLFLMQNETKGGLTVESAAKLQRILSKRFGRQLTEEELKEAYFYLMEFAYSLLDLSYPNIEVVKSN